MAVIDSTRGNKLGGDGSQIECDDTSPLVLKYAEARACRAEENCEKAISLFKEIIHMNGASEDSDAAANTRVRETAIYALAEAYSHCGKVDDLRNLLLECRPFFLTLPRARTAKLVRTLIDMINCLPNTGAMLIDLCLECIEWCKVEKRTFLRHRAEAKLIQLYIQQNRLQDASKLIELLLREVKQLDNRLMLVEIHLLETTLHWLVRNLPKSKAALTAARSNANSIHCPHLLQGDIDLQAGILHAQEGDFRTAYSYFFEAFEAFSSQNTAAPIPELGVVMPMEATRNSQDPRAVQSLKYLMLSKIMAGSPDEVNSILSGKQGITYIERREIVALKTIAKCHKERSLKLFEKTIAEFKPELEDDVVIRFHINNLHDNLFESNLLRILEPYDRVEITHIAKIIDLDVDVVTKKISSLILDKKLNGTLDQGVGVLLLYNDRHVNDMYQNVLTTIKNMSEVLETLHEKAHLTV